MNRPFSMFIFLLLLSFSVSQALPAEDVPETAYDESEGLPYEATPLFSIVVPQASARIAKAELCCSLLHFNSLTKRCKRRRENNARPGYVQDSLTILNHSLRC
jgi:hypothetical protein